MPSKPADRPHLSDQRERPTRSHPRACGTAPRGCRAGVVGTGFPRTHSSAAGDLTWALAYAPPSEAEVPADLMAAIAAEPAARAMFDLLTSTNRFALIYRVNSVKRAETRQRKIGELVAMLARHETIYPQKARPSTPS